ncbi:MAG: hypothetical protein ACLFWG_03435 [Longimicrobiales bacterium]
MSVPPPLRSATRFLAMGLAVAMLAPVAPAAAQSSGSSDYEPPTTIFGQPDLQGNWTNSTITPMQRPEEWQEFGLVLPASVVDSLESEAVAEFQEGLEPSDPDRPAPPVGGDGSTGAAGMVGGYNRVYIDPGYTVARVNGEPRSSLITHPEDGRVPELTQGGQASRMSNFGGRGSFGPYDHPELRPLGERCILSFGSQPGPPLLPNGFYNNNATIVQSPDHVMIMSEMVHDVRVVHLGDVDPPPDHIRPWFGFSRGHWEGNTLVVETTRIHPDNRVQGVSPSDRMKVTERFTRVADDGILYEFTVDDPVNFTEAWGGQVPMNALEGQIYEYACHEGNYALQNVLSGARYQERMEAQEAEQEGDSREP